MGKLSSPGTGGGWGRCIAGFLDGYGSVLFLPGGDGGFGSGTGAKGGSVVSAWAGLFARARGGEGVEKVFGCLMCTVSVAVWDL